jgi:3-oxoacyl-[acyl-carrier protein] reductase
MTRPPEPGQTLTVDGDHINIGVEKSATKFRDTSDIPLGRPGTSEEAAGCLLFLASNLSSYVTGQVLECNGGRFM